MKNVKEVEIKIDGEVWTKALDKSFEKANKDVTVDGFRKGKCPKSEYLKRFGIESLYMDAVDFVLNDAYRKALDDEKLEPVCEPKVDIKNISEKEVLFVFHIIEKPEVKLGKYTKLGVKKEKVTVSKEEIDEELKGLQDKFADIIDLNEGKLENGNTAVIDFEGKVDGKVLEGGTGSNYPLEIGSNTFIPGFEEGLVGMEIGEERILNLKFPENYVEDLKNKDVEFKVKLNGIKKRVLPEINEDFFKDLGYDDVKTEEELRNKLEEHIKEHKEAHAEDHYIDEVIKKALENLEVEINPEIIEDETNRMIDQYKQQLQMQGLSLEQYLQFTKSTVDDLKKTMEGEAVNRVKTRYLLEAVADKEKLEVSHDEIHEEAHKMSEQYNMSEDEIFSAIGGEDALAYDLRMRKAIDFLKNN